MNFDKSIFENRKELGRPFLVAHRGVCGANIPCNSILEKTVHAKVRKKIERGKDKCLTL